MLRRIVLAGVVAWSCTGKVDQPSEPTPPTPEVPVEKPTVACVSTRSQFERKVWSPFMSSSCGGCHTPGGSAIEAGARFVLQRETYPAFLEVNLAALKGLSVEDTRGMPKLLAKAQGLADHGGGPVLTPSSTEYQALSDLVATLRNNAEVRCSEANSPVFEGLTVMTPRQTLRKASIGLAGVVPSVAALDATLTEADLDARLTMLLDQPGFYEWLRDAWNDVLLTRKGYATGQPGVSDFHPDYYPRATYFQLVGQQDGATYEQYYTMLYSIIEQPLRLIEYIVRLDRPFTEVVTANYTVVNAPLEHLLGSPVPLAQVNYGARDTWHKVEHIYMKPGTQAQYEVPLAGVLTTAGFLSRYPTTQTNRSRARARAVYRIFLGTDLFTLSTRGVDTSSLTSVVAPVLNNGACTVCHKVMDPVAGFFRGFREQDGFYNFTFDPADPWHEGMFPPGTVTEVMPAAQYATAMQWGAAKLSTDRRFALATTQHMFRALTGNALLKYPTEPAAPDFDSKLAAFNAQDEYLQTLATQFTAKGSSLKWLIKAIIQGPYYRAVSHPSTDAELLAGFGFGKPLTPEQLSRKIRATTGVRYGAGWFASPFDGVKPHDYLTDSYAIQAGGIDSYNVVDRTVMHGALSAALMGKMASYVACKATPFDFSKPASQRTLFGDLELTTVPMKVIDGALTADAPAQEQLRATMVKLHRQLLGEELTPHDERIDATLKLFVDVWQELHSHNEVRLSHDGTSEGCGAYYDFDQPAYDAMTQALVPYTSATLPASRQISTDSNFTLRAWQAVVWYLLSEPSFLLE